MCLRFAIGALILMQPCFGAWAVTNSKAASTTATTVSTAAFTNALTNPSIIVAVCLGNNANNVLGGLGSSVSDTAGHTFKVAKVVGTEENSFVSVVWYALNTSTTASNVVTCTNTGSGFAGVYGIELTGGSTNDSPVDTAWQVQNKVGAAAGANSLTTACNASTAACTPSTNGDLILAVFQCNTGPCSAGTSPNAFTSILTSGGGIGVAEYFVQSTAAAINPTAGSGQSSDKYGATIVAFAPAGTSAFPLTNIRNDNVNVSDGTSLGQGWFLRHGQAETTDELKYTGTTTTAPLSVNPQVGDHIFGTVVYHPNAGTSANLLLSDSLGNVARGYVTKSGTAITFSKGIPFSRRGCNSTCSWNGQTITINGSTCTINAVTSFTALTVTSSGCVADSATPVTYVGPEWFCSETIQSGAWDIASCIASVTTGGADTITASTSATVSAVPADFGFNIVDIYNTKGILGVDIAACPVANCETTTGNSNASTGVISQSYTPSVSGELVFFNAGGSVGPLFATAGNTQVIGGVSGATGGIDGNINPYCNGSGAYTPFFCLNQEAVSLQTVAGTGTITSSITNGTHNDPGNWQTIGFEPGTAVSRRRGAVIQSQ